MTTTYDTDSTQSVSPTYYDTDPNTHTVAAAWASSPLGEPDGEVRYGFAATGAGEPDVAVDEPKPLATRAMLVAALVSGIVGGATLGAVLFGYADPAQPTVVVPGSGAAQTVPSNAVVATPSSPPAPPKPDAVPAPAPKTVVSAPKSAQAAAPAPKPAADPGTPPVSPQGDTTVVVDVPPLPPLPPLPDKPEPPDPEPPKPQIDDLKPNPKPQIDDLKPGPPTLSPVLPSIVLAP